MPEAYSREAEENLLGALLTVPHRLSELTGQLRAEDFYFADYRAIYQAICELHDTGTGVDFITVAQHLPMLPSGERTQYWTIRLAKDLASVANLTAYLAVVKDRALLRAIIGHGQRAITVASGEGCAEDKLLTIQADAMALAPGQTSGPVIELRDAVLGLVDVWQERHDRLMAGETVMGIPSGLTDLDKKTGGWQPGQLIVVAGRPSMGKTTLAMGFASHAAVHHQRKVLVISQEMRTEQLADRLVAAEGMIPLSALKDGSVCQTHVLELNNAVGTLKPAPLYLCDQPGLSMRRIRSLALAQQTSHGLDLLLIDYLQLLAEDVHAGSRAEDIRIMSREAKNLAIELGIPVFLLSQLSRKCEDRVNKRPLCSDLRDSGAIESDADIVLLLYRDEVYDENTEQRGIAEINIAKGRDIETGTVRVAFLGQFNAFRNLEALRQYPAATPDNRSLADRFYSHGVSHHDHD